MVKRTATGRARGTADAAPAIAELVNLTKAIGEILSAPYGAEMRISDRDALQLAEPVGRIVSRYAGATERLRELSDPVLAAGAIAKLLIPRAMRVMVGRAMRAAPAPVPEEASREIRFTETRTMREDVPQREPVDNQVMYRTLRRLQEAY